MNVSYTRGAPRGDGKFLRSALLSIARPTGVRTVSVACSSATSSILTIKADFHSNGLGVVISDTGDTPPWLSLHGVMCPL
ncbi:hypothetical protein [Streptomyces sp. NPDC053427]|uniref:hypothetical protein n=1 Tax=Streptomyces sp. NPDC053427 TaxID=3365701 RepID=UPI0037CD59C6